MDIAPVDLFGSMDKSFVNAMPDEMMPSNLKDQAIDIQIHWVSEAGSVKQSHLTCGLHLTPTVCINFCHYNEPGQFLALLSRLV